jgi:hypothetical protein
MTTRSEALPLIITAVEREIFLLERRKDGYQREMDEAIRAGTWSHVAGLDGHITGILICMNSLRESIKWMQIEYNSGGEVTKPVVRRVVRKVKPITDEDRIPF